MKKSIILRLSCAMTLSAMLLTGCNNEVTDGDTVAENEGKLSFVMPLGKKGPVSDAVTGTDAEYELDNLFIYWFKDVSGTYKLFQTFSFVNGGANNDITLSQSALSAASHSTVATISVGDAGNDSRFYIVANVNHRYHRQRHGQREG